MPWCSAYRTNDMRFTSVSFLLFAAVLLLLYYRIPRRHQWKLLLGASWAFLAWAGIRYLLFILFTTVTTYFSARILGKNLALQASYLAENGSALSREEKQRFKAGVKKKNRHVLLACFLANFGILFFCKACLIPPLHTALQSSRISFLTLALPLGISFYMFQSAGYVMDVSRGSVPAERSFFRLALFVSYFPQLVQGPITPYSKLSPQLFQGRAPDGKQLSFGLQRMLWGYFKKLVVADRIAAAVAALKGPDYTGFSFALLCLCYAVQIYGDFTGGIDIALGLSQALGITLPENFIRPFFSKNTAEYWRRWHITLGEWMKNYIFFPVSVSPGLRKLSRFARGKWGGFGKRLSVYAATAVTWFVTGIWHGLTPNFLLWGFLNCFVIVVSEELAPLYRRFHGRFHLKEKKWYAGFEMTRMFLLMNLIRVCDLFPRVGDYFARIGALFTRFSLPGGGLLPSMGLASLDWLILALGVGTMLAVSLIQEKRGSIRELLWARPAPLRRCIIFTLLVVVLLMGSYGIGYNPSSFIYNQF